MDLHVYLHLHLFLCSNIWLKISLTVQFTGPARHFHFSRRVLLFRASGTQYVCICACAWCVRASTCTCAWVRECMQTRDLKRERERELQTVVNESEGGLVRGYKPVVGVRAFIAEDQTEGSTTAKSGTVFFPHSASPYHCCSTMTAAHALDCSARPFIVERENVL